MNENFCNEKSDLPGISFMRRDLSWNDSPEFPLTMAVGSEGSQVEKLQRRLQVRGVYRGSVNGHFDNTTKNAVESFQRSRGLLADGVVGLKTWSGIFGSEF
jgi:peptidoglycan hydrolase-like protein with peptidoglycan-binding domain